MQVNDHGDRPADVPADRVSDPNDPQGRSEPRITLVGKPGCHLCDDAREVIRRVSHDLDVGWRELSILDDPELASRYAEQIPVTLVDGRQHDYWRVEESRLRAALAEGVRR